MTKQLVIQVQSDTGTVLFSRIVNYDNDVIVPFNSLVQSFDYLFRGVKHNILIGYEVLE